MHQWHRIYSSYQDGRSFNRLEYSLLGYSGPTVVLVKTTRQEVLGAFAAKAWRDIKGEFYGDSDCFLFALEPFFKVYRSKNEDSKFMYMHMNKNTAMCHGHPHGLGFGGTLDHPRFFIPESLERCTAGCCDKTFDEGELLPVESLEHFEIQFIEIWGVGGDVIIEKALKDRASHRHSSDANIVRVRNVIDKKQIASDFQSGLVPNKLYEHQDQARGRQEFVVDEKGGGYKIERS